METLQAQASAAFSCGTGEASCDSSGSLSSNNSPVLATPESNAAALLRAKSLGPELGNIATALDFELRNYIDVNGLTHIAGEFVDGPALGASVVGCTLAVPRPAVAEGIPTCAPSSRSPLRCRHVTNLAARPAASFLSPLAGAISDSEESEQSSFASSIRTSYPGYGAPCTSPRGATQHPPEYVNPLFDGDTSPSPLTQALSDPQDSVAASRASIPSFVSPTVHVQSQPSGRFLSQHHGHHDYHNHSHHDCSSSHSHHRQHGHPHQEPQRHGQHHACANSATVAAALPMLRGLSTHGSVEQRSLVSSLAALANTREDTHLGRIPWRSGGSGPNRQANPNAGRRRAGDCEGDTASGDGFGPHFEAALELLRHAAALQQQLEARDKEVASLQTQLKASNEQLEARSEQVAVLRQQLVEAGEERDAAVFERDEAVDEREELGYELLNCQGRVDELRSRLDQEARDKAAMASQSKLLQQQVQESEDAWRDAQKALQELQKSSQRYDQDYELCSLQAIADYGLIGADGSTLVAAVEAISGTEDAECVSGSEPRDPRDVQVQQLRRENQSLLQRLIASSLAQAQAREREEAVRHELHMLRELYQGAMDSVNAMSLELSLLRPNACGRASGRFNLPFLRRSGTSGGGGSGSAA